MQLLAKKILFLSILVLFIFPVVLQAQLKFTASVSSPTIGKDESFELKLMVENADNVEQISPPPLNNFNVISGPNQESRMESINGNTKRYTGITFILQPKSKGDFTIASAKAKADGKMLSSNPVTIKVVNNATGNSQSGPSSPFSGLMPFDEPVAEPQFNDFILKKGEKIQDKISKNIFIRAETNKTSCYVGEPLVVTYKLYTRLKSESNIVKNPSLNSFSVIDLNSPGNISYNVEKYNGREYNVYVLRKAQLYPLQPGDVELESAEVENNIHFVKEEFLNQRNQLDDLFQGFVQPAIPPEAMVDQKVTLRSEPVIIHVKPLPDAGKPASFHGAVGNFTIESSVEKNNFTTDDAGKLNVTIRGEGNLSLVNAPDLVWPDGVEGFDPKVNEDLNKNTVPVSGSKQISYPFTVPTAGSYTLPAVEFSFFDLASEKYHVITTKPITITVAKGTNRKPVLVMPVAGKPAKEQFFETIFSNRWMIILPIALLIIAGLIIWLRKEKKGSEKNKMQEQASAVKSTEEILAETKPDKIKVNPLAGTEDKMIQHDTNGFYEAVNKDLKNFLADKLGLHAETINKKSITDALDKTGLSLGESLQILQLLDDIELQLYTPFADGEKIQDIYDRANRAVHAFDKITA